MLARDYPEEVAGLVLLDPSAVNDARLAAVTEHGAHQQVTLSRIPVIRSILAAVMRRMVARLLRDRDLSPEEVAAFDSILQADLQRTSQAATGLTRIASAFNERPLRELPLLWSPQTGRTPVRFSKFTLGLRRNSMHRFCNGPQRSTPCISPIRRKSSPSAATSSRPPHRPRLPCKPSPNLIRLH